MVSIAIGSDAMQTTADVAGALGALSQHLVHDGVGYDLKTLCSTVWAIHDTNGNRVGEWSVRK